MQNIFHPGQCEKCDEKRQEDYLKGLRFQAVECEGEAVGPREPQEIIDQERIGILQFPGAAIGPRIPPQL